MTQKSLARSLKKQAKKLKEPLWRGPEEDGITQSLLSRFLVCRERFRLLVIEGLKPTDKFNHRIEYGSMWHECEEAYAKFGLEGMPWMHPLTRYAKKLCLRYRGQQEEVQHWYNVCKTQFPIYIDYWAKYNAIKNRTSLLTEETFCVPYILPSGRTVKLRGRRDSVDLLGKGKRTGIYLWENKTKGDIKEELLRRQLESGFDLQTMFYLVALCEHDAPKINDKTNASVKGVIYNVVRRPLAGGKHSISKLKNVNQGKRGPNGEKLAPRAETSKEYYTRLGGLIAKEPEHYFMRWKVEISSQDVERFQREFLDPILEQLYDWWDWIKLDKDPFYRYSTVSHWRTPFGFYNVLAEGGASELDEYLRTGSEVGLTRTRELFQELS